jgi:SAM-dependent methyltransferase
LDREYRRQLNVSIHSEFPQGTRHVLLQRCEDCGLEHYDPPVAGSAAFYQALSRIAGYYCGRRWEFEETLRRLPPDPDLVDVGCGDGVFLAMVSGSRKRGLELNPEAVARARGRGLNVKEGLLGDLQNESTDILTLFQVLEHVPRPHEVLQEAARVLRPGGQLYVAVPNNDGWMGNAPHDVLNAPPHHPLRWRVEALRNIARIAPFRVEEILEEPLAPEHVFKYRQAQFRSSIGRLLGRRLPLYDVDAGGRWIRRLSSAWAMAAARLVPQPRGGPGSGASLLAILRKTTP